MMKKTIYTGIFGLVLGSAALLTSCGKDICVAGIGEYCKQLGKNMSGGTGSTGGVLRFDPTLTYPTEWQTGVAFTVRYIGGQPPYDYEVTDGTASPVIYSKVNTSVTFTPSGDKAIVIRIRDSAVPTPTVTSMTVNKKLTP